MENMLANGVASIIFIELIQFVNEITVFINRRGQETNIPTASNLQSNL